MFKKYFIDGGLLLSIMFIVTISIMTRDFKPLQQMVIITMMLTLWCEPYWRMLYSYWRIKRGTKLDK